MDLLSPAKLNLISLDVKQWREHVHVPVMVATREEFRDLYFALYRSYQQTFPHTAPPGRPSSTALESGPPALRRQAQEDLIIYERWRAESFAFVTQHLGADHLDEHERRCLTGREGGAITFADELAEALEKYHTELYLRRVFYDAFAPWDYETRLRLATELLDHYGRYLFPEDTLQHPVLFAANFEHFIRAFINQLHVIRKAWRV